MNLKSPALAALFFFLLAIPFQNCSYDSESKTQQSTTVKNSSGGNGWAYDKVYVDLLASGNLCADGSPIQTQINVIAGAGRLIRENCTNLAPAQQINVTYTTDPSNNRMIVYNGIHLFEVAFTGMSVATDSKQNIYATASGGTNDTSGSVPRSFVSITKLNPEGLIEWSKFAPSFGYNNLFVKQGRGLSNGNMVYIARVTDTGPSFLFVINPSGQVIWTRRYIDGSLGLFARGFVSIDVDSSDNIFAAGLSTPASGSPFVFIAKWNAQGDLLWQKQITSVLASPVVRVSSTGELFVAGRITNTGGYLLRLDTAGNILSSTIINLAEYPNSSDLISLDFLKNGDLILTGFGFDSAQGTATHFIARLTVTGSVAWSQTMNDSFGTLPTRPIFATVADDGTIFYSAVYGNPISEPNKMGKVGHLNADGSAIREIVFTQDKAPTSIQSAVVPGANGRIWMAATTPTFFTNGLGQTTTFSDYGLLLMDTLQSSPCSTCTIWPSLITKPTSLAVSAGDLTVTTSGVVFEIPSEPLKFVDSPIPINILK